MAPSLVEKYERILAADPRSRVFVELARALLERGDHLRAVEVCRRGLEHHPSSILARVTWGRALLEAGELPAALDQLEIAIGIDPANPYAYNLAGEALLRKGHHREALPVLARAAELQPADGRVRALLEEARQRARPGSSTSLPAAVTPEAAAPAPAPAFAAAPPVVAAPAAAPATPPQEAPTPPPPAAPEEPTLLLSLASEAEVEVELGTSELGALGASPTGELPAAPEAAPVATGELPAAEALDEEALPLAALLVEDDPVQPAPAAAPPPVLPRLAARGAGLPAKAAVRPFGAPTPHPAGLTAAPAGASPEEVARIAAAYAEELRERMERSEGPPPPPARSRTLLLTLLVAAVAGAAGWAFVAVRERTRTEVATQALEAARAGLARDTRASLEQAAGVLATAHLQAPRDEGLRAQLLSLEAQVAAVRAVDHGDAAARALAHDLGALPDAGDGGLVTRLLLAERPEDRASAEADVLAAPPGAAPLLQRLAGQVLLGRGEVAGGRGRLLIAAQASPPSLGALCDLGDSHLAAGEAEAALERYELALRLHPTHPRAALGAAEARLALGRPADESLRALRAVEEDPGSAPPLAVRRRFELGYARALAQAGQVASASHRLVLAAGSLPEPAGLQAERAALLLAAGALEEAEAAAAQAVRLDPAAEAPRVLLARTRLALHRDAAALEALPRDGGREAWLVRGMALEQLGRHAQARAALERTARHGRLTPEAATWYALTGLTLQRVTQALAVLGPQAQAPGATPFTHAVHGRALAAAKRFGEAEAACRRAIELGPELADGPACLGRVQLAAGRRAEAVAPLTRAVALDGRDPELARLLTLAQAPAPRPARRYQTRFTP